ncbi:hypothetical protein AVEN_170899-1, partial [Araneus ventricosus]
MFHTARFIQEKIEEFRYQLLKYPHYSLDLAPSDYHLLGPLKLHLESKRFVTDAEAERIWDSCSKTFMQE